MNAKRVSMVKEYNIEIYIDFSVTEPTIIEYVNKVTGQETRYKVDTQNGIEHIMPVLERIVHPRFTRITVDGGTASESVIGFIDNKYNWTIEALERTTFESVEVRKAANQDIEKRREDSTK